MKFSLLLFISSVLLFTNICSWKLVAVSAESSDAVNLQTVLDTNAALDFDAFIPQGTLKRAPALTALMKEYISQHSILANRMDPDFCSRKFVVGIYACPHAVGNHMFEFLNGYLAAVMTNRTILWQFCERRYCNWDDEIDCEQFIHRFRWILSYKTAQIIWKKRNCSSPLLQSVDDIHTLYDFRLHGVAEETVACCQLEDFEHPFLSVGINCFMEMYAMTTPRAILSPAARQRADIIREHKAQFAYGFLFRTAFKINDSIIAENNELIASALRHTGKQYHNSNNALISAGSSDKCNEPLLVALHLRHADANDHGRDHGEADCLKQTIDRVQRHYGCPMDAVLLASDRSAQLLHWEHSHEFPQQKIITSNHSSRHQLVGYTAEHGVNNGIGAILDIDLLSRANAFIGSHYFTHLEWLNRHASTFSMLIACLQSTNGVASSDLPSAFLPFCSSMDHNDAKIKPLYDDASDFACSADYITKNAILLPTSCPAYVPL